MTRPMALARALAEDHDLPDKDLQYLLETPDPSTLSYLRQAAQAAAVEVFGRRIYLRGLIEFSNHCKNNCLYCGIRRDNETLHRYRLTEEEILGCCKTGYALGFRTFVLQSGEDPWYNDVRLRSLVRAIKLRHPDCAVTLSVGERSRESYRRLQEAGADRYLLRHETADPTHYAMLHPKEMSWEHRMNCLQDLKDLGYQVGAGMMIGSPGQSAEFLVKDLRFLKTFRPHMVGIGPFVSHPDTPFSWEPDGSAMRTLRVLALVRLLLPSVLLPATTALNSILPDGLEQGILYGANVVMPNLTPIQYRQDSSLYHHKRITGAESAEGVDQLRRRLHAIGYEIDPSRGDSPDYVPIRKDDDPNHV